MTLHQAKGLEFDCRYLITGVEARTASSHLDLSEDF